MSAEKIALQTKEGYTALHWAARNGRTETAIALSILDNPGRSSSSSSATNHVFSLSGGFVMKGIENKGAIYYLSEEVFGIKLPRTEGVFWSQEGPWVIVHLTSGLVLAFAGFPDMTTSVKIIGPVFSAGMYSARQIIYDQVDSGYVSSKLSEVVSDNLGYEDTGGVVGCFCNVVVGIGLGAVMSFWQIGGSAKLGALQGGLSGLLNCFSTSDNNNADSTFIANVIAVSAGLGLGYNSEAGLSSLSAIQSLFIVIPSVAVLHQTTKVAANTAFEYYPEHQESVETVRKSFSGYSELFHSNALELVWDVQDTRSSAIDSVMGVVGGDQADL